MDLGLHKKTVFITGGSSGIGEATALAYGKEAGVRIAISYFQGRNKALEIVRAIHENGGTAMAVPMNLANHDSIGQAVDAIIEKWGRIDVLINNAVQWGSSAHRGKSFEDMPMEQWEETLSVNLFGTVKVTQAVVPYMRKNKWGRIVNISSDLAKDSMKGSGPYSALKSALFGFTANLVEELSSDGILSNVVLPSWTLTDRARKFFPERFQEEAKEAFPTHRVTLPEEVASLILYLGSAANGHVNGEHIMVTGKGSQPMLSAYFRKYMTSQSSQNKV